MLERGTVVSSSSTPRSYIIDTPSGTLRRNRYHLSPTPKSFCEAAPENTATYAVSTPDTPAVQCDSGQQSPRQNRHFPTRVRVPLTYLKDCLFMFVHRHRKLSGQWSRLIPTLRKRVWAIYPIPLSYTHTQKVGCVKDFILQF